MAAETCRDNQPIACGSRVLFVPVISTTGSPVRLIAVPTVVSSARYRVAGEQFLEQGSRVPFLRWEGTLVKPGFFLPLF